MLNLITMIENINSFLLLTLLRTIYSIYYKCKIFFPAINIVINSIVHDQFSVKGKEVDSEVIKTIKGRKKKTATKTLPTMNEEEGNDIRKKRDRLVICVLSGNSKQYLGI